MRLYSAICAVQCVPVTARKVAPVILAESQPYFNTGDILENVMKTVGIKLNLIIPQEQELKTLFEAFRTGINWSLNEIEKRYQVFVSRFEEIPKENRIDGVCPECNTEKNLTFLNRYTNRKYCSSCAMKTYSEYTVRKEIYGVGDRVVANDLKSVIEIPVKTHYAMLFSQAYAMWKSYNAWRIKRNRELGVVEAELSSYPDQRYLHAAMLIEQKAADTKRSNPKMIWKTAKAHATKEVFRDFSDKEQKEIRRLHDKLMDVRRLKRPISFPHLEECRTIMMASGFVQWDNGELYLTLWGKGRKRIDFWGKEYLKQYILKMEADNNVYCNITKKNGDYYLMYPLEIKVKQPPAIEECDPFVVLSSPTRIGVFGYDEDGALNSVKWMSTGQLAFSKRHFKEKRAEITVRKSPDEKMRKIRRRRKKIRRRGNVEQRYVSTYNHQISRKVVDYIMEQSENPKILLWDVGNGITQNFGKQLNYLKNLWPVVQQQDYLRHKAMQVSIPIVEIKYNKCNDLVCSSCGAKQKNGKKPAKAITQLIKGIKNFKCESCGYEVNQLINQANNIVSMQ
ncbi:hypothetical protein ANME2D_02343 [Candidatus Methanoperedens nitroreducens]|uniref:Transposase n=1 Tax=Candidatus Methanoperedens nitratireducens TaxID=1392998 RepID=A0A062V4S7_9EURY|nr:hypothetical protein ANME2D_02343 [Candidatus Methanoperedens nitroreducens]